MRKKIKILFLGIICILCFSGIKAQLAPALESWVVEHHPECFVNGNIDLNCPGIVNADTIRLLYDDISSLDGLQYFTHLVYLDISGSNDGYGFITVPQFPPTLKGFKCTNMDFEHDGLLYYFDLSWVLSNLPAGLEYLDCSSNYAINMPALPASLKYLKCTYNALDELPVLPATLDTLICSFNQQEKYDGISTTYYGLNTLPALPATLKYLDCSWNRINSLPALPSSLKYLDCNWNQINSSVVPFPNLPAGLTFLSCYNNSINDLHVLPATLQYLNCSSNSISNLHELPISLTYLDCGGDHLISNLPDLPQGLTELRCMGCSLTNLPALPDSLQLLFCGYNSLTELPALPPKLSTIICEFNNITCLPHLPASMGNSPVGTDHNLTFDADKINCFPNTVNGITVFKYGVFPQDTIIPPLCTPINNVHQCHGYPIVSGQVFYDNNSNGIKDANEYYKRDIRLDLSNNEYAFTDNSGYFELSADIGNYTLGITTPGYYTAVPSTASYTFSTYDTLVSKLIALQPNVSVDSFMITVTPQNIARPGFDFPYYIEYENIGSTTVAPHIELGYDAARLTYGSSTNASVTDLGGFLTLLETAMVPGERRQFVADFTVKTTAQLHDTIYAIASVAANSSIASDNILSVVSGSYDPNDKQATPELTPEQVAGGKYIDYLIRFQNTGTDTAFNIVITDTLSGLLQSNSLQVVNASHSCKASQEGNKIAFEFLNVLVPDSNVNEPASHGFVRFKVRPQNSVVVSNIIPNNAAIYFDYNEPVLTNTANTLIQLLTVPLHLLSFKAFTNDYNEALLYWNTENEFNTMSFEIEQSTDGRNFITLGRTAARGQGSNKYSYKTMITTGIVYYRLKIIDIDGRFTYSQVIQVKRNKKAESIVVLNNPTKNTLSLIITDVILINTTVSIINEQGLVVKKFILNDGLQNIDVSNLSTGIYYLKTIAETKKLMINH